VLFDALRRLRSGAGRPDEFETKVRGRVKRYRNRLRGAIQGGEHQQRGSREGVAEMLLNMHADFAALAEDADCTADDLKDALASVASTAQCVEMDARGNARNGGYWHNDFRETELDRVAQTLETAANAVGLGDDDSVISEDTPCPFDVRELPDFVDALAAGQSGRDIGQFVDTLNLRIRGLLARGRLGPVVQPDDSTSIRLEDWLGDHIGRDQAANGPIAVIDLSLVPCEVIHIVVSVLARMVFEAVHRYRR